MQVPFHRVYLTGGELTYITDAMHKGSLSGNGHYTRRVQSWMQANWHAARAFLTTSGTSALEMAMLCLRLQPGDQVVMPSYTFVSTANAVVLRGALPVFAEIDPQTMNLDAADVASRINHKTRAILPVHYGGISCDMQGIMEVADFHELMVVEDAAQGAGAFYQDHPLGSIGHLGCLSFHGTKNITAGEGGALLLNKPSRDLAAQAEIIWEKGTDRSQYLQGKTDRYTWQEAGSSFAPADLLAALLLAQLEHTDTITALRKRRFDRYFQALQPYERKELIRLPHIPSYAGPNYHIFYLICPSERKRNQLLHKLAEQGIQAAFHFVPLHVSTMGKRLGYQPGQLPLTEKMSGRLLRLPLYPDLTETEQEYVIEQVITVIDRWS